MNALLIRWLRQISVALLCAVLAGCGGDGEDSADPGQQSNSGQRTNAAEQSNDSDSGSASSPDESRNERLKNLNPAPDANGGQVGKRDGDTVPGSKASPGPDGQEARLDSPGQASAASGLSSVGADTRKMDHSAHVQAAIDDAIKRIEAGDVYGFLDHYLPVKELQQLRQYSTLEEAAAEIKSSREQDVLDRLLDQLRRAKGQKPKFNEGSFYATIELKQETPDAGPPEPPKYVEPETTDAKLAGFGNDLKAVMEKAVAALKDNDVKTFVANVFPAGELRRPDADRRLQMLESRVEANPQMVEQMIEDLEELSGMTPTLEKDGAEAVFVLKGGEPEKKPGQRNAFPYPDRTIRFQLVEGSWRFFDNTTSIRKTIARQLTLPPVEIGTTGEADHLLVFERFGDRWRLAKIRE